MTKASTGQSIKNPIEDRDNDQRNFFGLFEAKKEDKLSEEEIAFLKEQIIAIGADLERFRFNERSGVCFVDHEALIYVNKEILSLPGKQPPAYDLSIRGILAHEYWGHLANHPSPFEPDSDEDESWADDSAARKSKGLSDKDRAILFRRSLAYMQRARHNNNIDANVFRIRIDDVTRRYLTDDEIRRFNQ